MKRAFDKKVGPREFQEEELVMKKIITVQRDCRNRDHDNAIKKLFFRNIYLEIRVATITY